MADAVKIAYRSNFFQSIVVTVLGLVLLAFAASLVKMFTLEGERVWIFGVMAGILFSTVPVVLSGMWARVEVDPSILHWRGWFRRHSVEASKIRQVRVVPPRHLLGGYMGARVLEIELEGGKLRMIDETICMPGWLGRHRLEAFAREASQVLAGAN